MAVCSIRFISRAADSRRSNAYPCLAASNVRAFA
jgi:hypothetical protein